MRNKKQLILGIILLITGIITILGISIWNGFPPTNFNRIPVSFASVLISLGLIGGGIGMIATSNDL